MARVPELDEVIAEGTDFKKMRDVIIEQREAGTKVEDIAESVLVETKVRYDAGDLNAADALLFHAVHAGVRPSELFLACRKEKDKEA